MSDKRYCPYCGAEIKKDTVGVDWWKCHNCMMGMNLAQFEAIAEEPEDIPLGMLHPNDPSCYMLFK